MVGSLAVLGTLLLFIGVSLSSAASVLEDNLLPSILRQLKQQGKAVKSTSVFNSGAASQIVVVLANGEVRKYNQQGQLVETKDAMGKVTIYKDGMAVEERDALGAVISRTEYLRSESGKIREMIKHTAGGIETKQFDADGNVIQSTDSRGTKTYGHYEKDGAGRTLSYQEVDLNNGKAQRVILDPKTGDVTEKIDDEGVHTRTEYQRDAAGEITAVVERDSNGGVVTKKFSNGQLVEMNKNGVVTTFENTLGQGGRLQETKERTVTPSASGPIVELVTKKFDAAGRMLQMTDREGVHDYSYDLGAAGKIGARRERVTSKRGGKTQVKNITTTYDENGRVVGVDEGNKVTTMSYVLDGKGNILSQTETKRTTVNNKVYTETTRKDFDGKGHLVGVTDSAGKKSTYNYDGKGNRTSVVTPESRTDFIFDEFNNLRSSITRDKKSTTFTYYEKDGKLPSGRLKILKNGFVEVTNFMDNNEGERVAVTREQFGIKQSTFISRDGEQPKETVFVKHNGKVITTQYEYAGDNLLSSREVGPQGVTDTKYNMEGKPESQERTDRWGHAFITAFKYVGSKLNTSVETDKKGTTTTEYDGEENATRIVRENTVGYPRRSVEVREYAQGELIKSVTTDKRGESVTKFDSNGMATEVKRINKRGFPRENTTVNAYDAGGDIKETIQSDNRGKTQNLFDADGQVAKSVRDDIYGFPKRKTTSYQYESGEMVGSTMEDDRGATLNRFNADGLMTESTRTKRFGYPREEKSTFRYDNDGYMVSSKESDVNGVTNSTYNADELMVQSVRENSFGHARKQTTDYVYDTEGFMTACTEKDLKGETKTEFNRDGLALTSARDERYGLEYARQTQTKNEYDSNGFMTVSHSKNLLSTTDSTFDKDNLVRRTEQQDVYGPTRGTHKITEGFEYDQNGRILKSAEKDGLGSTQSTFDADGDATETRRIALLGATGDRDTVTKTVFEKETGMPVSSVSKNENRSTSTTFNEHGVALESITEVNLGAINSRKSTTKIDADKRTGITLFTRSETKMGWSEARFDPKTGKEIAGGKSHTEIGPLGTRDNTTDEVEASDETGIVSSRKTSNLNGWSIVKFDEDGLETKGGRSRRPMSRWTGRPGSCKRGRRRTVTAAGPRRCSTRTGSRRWAGKRSRRTVRKGRN